MGLISGARDAGPCCEWRRDWRRDSGGVVVRVVMQCPVRIHVTATCLVAPPLAGRVVRTTCSSRSVSQMPQASTCLGFSEQYPSAESFSRALFYLIQSIVYFHLDTVPSLKRVIHLKATVSVSTSFSPLLGTTHTIPHTIHIIITQLTSRELKNITCHIYGTQ